jgi:hypothetical protein
MRSSAKAVILGVAIGLIVIGLSYPIGPPSCSGADCYTVGPFQKPGPGGAVSVQILFPGSLTYADGTSQSLSSSKSILGSVTGGTSNKAIAQASFAVQVVVVSSSPVSVKVTGYITEIASRRTSDPLGAYLNQVSNVSILQTITTVGTAVQILGVTHAASDFTSMSDLGSKTSTSFSYNLAGSLNFNIGAPINKSASSIFAWPNLAIGVSVPPPPSGGGPPPPTGGGGCSPIRGVYCITLASPQGVAYSWFVLGTFPAFSVAAAANGKSVLQRLGIL